MNKPLLSVENLHIAYPQSLSLAVEDVCFTLNPQQKLGLVGESGCGKSTLGRAIMGLLPPSTQIQGDIKFQGQSIFTYNRFQWRKFRGEVVGLIFQDPMTRLDPLMTIGEHCLETLLAHQPHLSRRQAKEKALATLDSVKIPASRWSAYPHEFSGGMRQRVAIALALLLDPKLIIADEPTTSLDVTIATEILQELNRLAAERDLALMMISHDLGMVGKYGDRLAVMYQGKIVETGNVQIIFQQPQHTYTQSLLQAAFHLHSGNKQEQTKKLENEPILTLKNLQKHFVLETNLWQQFILKKPTIIKAVDDINLTIYQGEILGLVGESGCGKSTLSRTILQILKPTAGQVIFQGQDLTKLSRQKLREVYKDIQMIFQDPHACLNPMMTVGENIAEPLLIHKIANKQVALEQVKEILAKVGLTPVEEYYKRYPKELSGGQQQRVGIGRALITNPKLIICDEPVSMLDASIQAQVLELMLELKQSLNLTYLFITHDLGVARFLSDRLAVMNQGKIVELGKTEQIFNQPQHPYTQKLLKSVPLVVNNWLRSSK